LHRFDIAGHGFPVLGERSFVSDERIVVAQIIVDRAIEGVPVDAGGRQV
jgi:hypothetical protein